MAVANPPDEPPACAAPVLGRAGCTAVRALLLIVALLATGCHTPEQRHEVLSFFFDGVPPPESMRDTVQTDTLTGDAGESAIFPQHSEHPPWLNRQCRACHDIIDRGPLVRASDLCLTCHKKEKVILVPAHAPVGDGSCLVCHEPHQSEWQKLLRETPEKLCAHCHDYKETRFATRHKPLGTDRNCTDCHDGHGGKGPSFLKTGLQVCGRCHFNDMRKRAPLHGPVAAGMCTLCHGGHGGKEKSLLKIRGDALCSHCHLEADLRSRSPHENGDLKGCTKCHDPHGSGKRYMLRPDPKSAPRKVPKAGGAR